MPVKTFRHNGNILDIPDEKVGAFLLKYPDAIEARSFTIGKDTLDIPLDKVEGFKTKYPTAKPLYEEKSPDYFKGFGDVLAEEMKPDPSLAIQMLGAIPQTKAAPLLEHGLKLADLFGQRVPTAAIPSTDETAAERLKRGQRPGEWLSGMPVYSPYGKIEAGTAKTIADFGIDAFWALPPVAKLSKALKAGQKITKVAMGEVRKLLQSAPELKKLGALSDEAILQVIKQGESGVLSTGKIVAKGTTTPQKLLPLRENAIGLPGEGILESIQKLAEKAPKAKVSTKVTTGKFAEVEKPKIIVRHVEPKTKIEKPLEKITKEAFAKKVSTANRAEAARTKVSTQETVVSAIQSEGGVSARDLAQHGISQKEDKGLNILLHRKGQTESFDKVAERLVKSKDFPDAPLPPKPAGYNNEDWVMELARKNPKLKDIDKIADEISLTGKQHIDYQFEELTKRGAIDNITYDEFANIVKKGKDFEKIGTGKLKQGDEFTIGGEKFKVTKRTDDAVTIKDGTTKHLDSEFDNIVIDKGSLKKAKNPTLVKMMEESNKRQAKTDKFISENEGKPFKVSLQRTHQDKIQTAFVHKDPTSKNWRVTWSDKDGMINHTGHNTYREAVETLSREPKADLSKAVFGKAKPILEMPKSKQTQAGVSEYVARKGESGVLKNTGGISEHEHSGVGYFLKKNKKGSYHAYAYGDYNAVSPNFKDKQGAIDWFEKYINNTKADLSQAIFGKAKPALSSDFKPETKEKLTDLLAQLHKKAKLTQAEKLEKEFINKQAAKGTDVTKKGFATRAEARLAGEKPKPSPLFDKTEKQASLTDLLAQFKKAKNVTERAALTQKIELAKQSTLTGKEFAKGTLSAIKKDITSKSSGITADPYRNLKSFLKENKLQLSQDEIAKIHNLAKNLAKETIPESARIQRFESYISKSFPKIKFKSTLEKVAEKAEVTPSAMKGVPDEVNVYDKKIPLIEEKFSLPIHKKVTDVIEKTMDAKGIQRDKIAYPNLSDQMVYDVYAKGKISFKDVEKYGVTEKEFMSMWRDEITDAARRLAHLSQAQRRFNVSGLKEVVDDLSDLAKTATPDWTAKITPILRRLDNIRRGMMVSQLSTAVRNAASQAMRIGTDVLDEAIEVGLAKMVKPTGLSKTKIGKKWGLDLYDEATLKSALQIIGRLGKKNQKILEDVLQFMPREHDRMFMHYASDVFAGTKLGGTLGKVEKTVHALNWANRLQEFGIRRAAFVGKLNELMVRKGKDFYGVVKRSEDFTADMVRKYGEQWKSKVSKNDRAVLKTILDDIPQDDIKKSVDFALEMTFAQQPKGKVARSILNAVNSMPFVPVVGTGQWPFARFAMNAIKFNLQHSPLGFMRLLKPGAHKLEAISRAVTGSILLKTGYELRKSDMAGERWYELKIDGETYDTRAYNPFAAYLFMGDVIHKIETGTIYKMTFKDWSNGIIGSNLRGGIGMWTVDKLVASIYDDKSFDRFKEDVKEYAGGIASGYFQWFNQFNELISEFNPEYTKKRESNQSPLTGQTISKIPFLSTTLPERESPTRAATPERKGSLLKVTTGLSKLEQKNPFEKELDKYGFSYPEIYPRAKDKTQDYLIRREMGMLTEELIIPRIKEKDYQNGTDAKKQFLISKLLKLTRMAAKLRAVGKYEEARQYEIEIRKSFGNKPKREQPYYKERRGEIK